MSELSCEETLTELNCEVSFDELACEECLDELACEGTLDDLPRLESLTHLNVELIERFAFPSYRHTMSLGLLRLLSASVFLLAGPSPSRIIDQSQR